MDDEILMRVWNELDAIDFETQAEAGHRIVCRAAAEHCGLTAEHIERIASEAWCSGLREEYPGLVALRKLAGMLQEAGR